MNSYNPQQTPRRYHLIECGILKLERCEYVVLCLAVAGGVVSGKPNIVTDYDGEVVM